MYKTLWKGCESCDERRQGAFQTIRSVPVVAGGALCRMRAVCRMSQNSNNSNSVLGVVAKKP